MKSLVCSKFSQERNTFLDIFMCESYFLKISFYFVEPWSLDFLVRRKKRDWSISASSYELDVHKKIILLFRMVSAILSTWRYSSLLCRRLYLPFSLIGLKIILRIFLSLASNSSSRPFQFNAIHSAEYKTSGRMTERYCLSGLWSTPIFCYKHLQVAARLLPSC